MTTSKIGTRVILLRPMLGENAGSIGYVVNEYKDYEEFSQTGVQVVFEKGGFDGFSYKEQTLYLEFLEIVPQYAAYTFNNVLSVYNDFRRGFWRFHNDKDTK